MIEMVFKMDNMRISRMLRGFDMHFLQEIKLVKLALGFCGDSCSAGAKYVCLQ